MGVVGRQTGERPVLTRREILAGAGGVSAALLLPGAAQAATHAPGHPRPWKWADDGHGRPFSKDPSVIRFGDRYLLYYSVPPTTDDSRWGQAVAVSTDLTNWTHSAEIGRGICAADAIVIGGRVHLFVQTYGNSTTDSICHGVSTDGVNFAVDRTHLFNPAGSWTCGRAIDAEARIIGDELFVYWATRDRSFTTQMIGCHSTALSGASKNFKGARWYQRAGGPVLRPTLWWEKRCVEAPSLQAIGGGLTMFYAGAYNNQPQQIGVAYSTDGLHWSKDALPFLTNGRRGSSNFSESGHPGVFFDPTTGKTWLFYQANNDGGQTWYIAKRLVHWAGRQPWL